MLTSFQNHYCRCRHIYAYLFLAPTICPGYQDSKDTLPRSSFVRETSSRNNRWWTCPDSRPKLVLLYHQFTQPRPPGCAIQTHPTPVKSYNQGTTTRQYCEKSCWHNGYGQYRYPVSLLVTKQCYSTSPIGVTARTYSSTVDWGTGLSFTM